MLEQYTVLQQITKGFSTDRKYVVQNGNEKLIVRLSVPFAVGMIEGYHDGKPPQSFWELYALYLAMSVFSSVVWGQIQGDGGELLRHAEHFIQDHEGFTKSVPSWYQA